MSGPAASRPRLHPVTPAPAREELTGDPGPCAAHGIGGSCGACLLEAAVIDARAALALDRRHLSVVR